MIKGRRLAVAAALAMLLPFAPGCGKGPTTPEGPYSHSLRIVAKTLHFGEAVTGTFTVKMLANGKTFEGTVGETLDLDTTASLDEMCDILISCAGCLPREFRWVTVSHNVLATDVLKLADFDIDYLLTQLLTTRDAEGRAINRSWRPTLIKGSSNPDRTTGQWLDPAFLEGTGSGPSPGVEGILPALHDFERWGKRYAGTPAEAPYVTSVAFDVQSSFADDNTVLPDGEFRVFRADRVAGISVVNFPSTAVKVSASVERIDPSSATPLDAYRWTLGALIGKLGPIEDLAGYEACLPVLMWRSRDKYSYGISVIKESQTRIDAFNTFETLPAAPGGPGIR